MVRGNSDSNNKKQIITKIKNKTKKKLIKLSMKKIKSYRPRVRVRGNSDSKNRKKS